MKHIRNFISMVMLIAAISVVFNAGCQRNSKKPSQGGKFTEEQMETLPFAPRADLPQPSGGMVLSISTETVTVNEMINPLEDLLAPAAKELDFPAFRQQASEVMIMALRDKVTEILLYQKARQNAPENIDAAVKKAVEQEVNRFVAQYGNDRAEAQKAIAQMGLDWDGFRKYQEKLLIVQSYVTGEISEEQPVTHDQLLEYYESVKAERFQWEGELLFRVIDINTDKLTDEQVNIDQGETYAQAAMRIGQKLRFDIDAGEDFEKLAKQHSHLRASSGGLWSPVIPGSGSLAKPYDVLETEAMKINAGSIVGPIQADGHVFILKLESKTEPGSQPFDKVQGIIEREVEMVQRKERYDKLIQKIIDQAHIPDAGPFIEFCVRQAYKRFR